jgi:hypothetical protein
MPQIFIVLSIAVIAVIVLLLFSMGRFHRRNTITPIAGLAFSFVISGIFFGDDRMLGYSLLAIGVMLAVVDIYDRSRST